MMLVMFSDVVYVVYVCLRLRLAWCREVDGDAGGCSEIAMLVGFLMGNTSDVLCQQAQQPFLRACTTSRNLGSYCGNLQ